MLFPVHLTDFFGYYLISVREGDFWMLVTAAVLLAVWVPYIVNKPQPAPRWKGGVMAKLSEGGPVPGCPNHPNRMWFDCGCSEKKEVRESK